MMSKSLLKFTKTRYIRNKSTSANIGFAKAVLKFHCVEDFRNFSRKKPFYFTNFCILAKENGFAKFSVYRKF